MLRYKSVAFLVALGACVIGTGEARAVQVLGTGTAALLGNDLTDLGNDGVEALYAPPNNYGGFDAEFFSSDEPGFEGGEFAFNVFDNRLGPTNDKWCCGTVFPQVVGADFRNTLGAAFRLTHFTVSSANDAPERDPVLWRIEGSNDGVCWITIFSHDDLALALDALGRPPGTAIWSDRLQVIRFDEGEDYPVQDTGFSMFRMVTTQTGLTSGAFFQIGEIEFFGEQVEPPTEPPTGCEACGSGVMDFACSLGAGKNLSMSWKNPCICIDPISIRVNGAEIATVPPDATSYTLPAASFPPQVFTVEVVNCSGAAAVCNLFKTLSDGLFVGTAWLALGPFATPVGCDGDATLFLKNPIGPEESIRCQFPAEGDPVEGYVPGNPYGDDPNTSSTMGYHSAAPTDEFGNPVWRLFSDGTPGDGDLNFDQGPTGPVDQHVQFVATWIENKSAVPITVGACLGSDDDAQAWLDSILVYNMATCRGRALCQSTFNMTLKPGIHVIKVGVWEEGGDWGLLFSLFDPETGEPIVDLGGIFEIDDLVGVSPLSADLVFHGAKRPANFVEPPCDPFAVCQPVMNLGCLKNDDGTIDLWWENSEGCDSEIQVFAGSKLVATLPPTATSYSITDPIARYTASVSVENGTATYVGCRMVEVLGTGTVSLLGNDLTDLGDDGIETLYAPPGDYGNFDAEFFSSDEPGFEGGEAAFNVFDNKLGPTNDKWCCGTTFPQFVGADFTNTQGIPFRLTHFTVSSANDVPERDPRVWRIEGSNDGVTWTTIFSQNDPNLSLWTERLQVILFEEGRDYPVHDKAYFMFRMITDRTGLPSTPGNAFFQVGEIEFFGEEGGAVEICDNKIDDDGDRLIDCADPSCAASPACQARFERGDADGSGSINITDGIYILNYLFLGGDTPGCLDSSDTNDDGGVNITDGIYILNYLFLGGSAPPPPHGTCGTDPTADDTGCEKPHTQGNCA